MGLRRNVMANILKVQATPVAVKRVDDHDFISLTDIAKRRDADSPADIVKNCLRSRSTIEFLGLWEQLNNLDFNPVEFDQFKNRAAANRFVLSPIYARSVARGRRRNCRAG